MTNDDSVTETRIERAAKALQELDAGKGIDRPWSDYMAEATRFAAVLAALNPAPPAEVRLNRPGGW